MSQQDNQQQQQQQQQDENKEDIKSESIVLNLESLSAEYDTTLLQYNQVQTDYINYLNTQANDISSVGYIYGPYVGENLPIQAVKVLNGSESVYMIEQGIYTKMVTTSGVAKYYTGIITDYKPNNWGSYTNVGSNYLLKLIPQNNLTNIKGQVFWGSGPINSNTNVTTVNDCEALCSSTNKCSGATFNISNNTCSLRTGEGDLVSSSDDNYAIIPENIKYLNTLKQLNKRLTDINKQIIQLINQNKPFYNTLSEKENERSNLLNQNYEQLNYEQIKIAKFLQDSEDLDEAQNQGNITTNKNYYKFILLLIILIVCIVILLKFSSSASIAPYISNISSISNNEQSTSNPSNPYYKIFGIIIFCLIIYYFMKYNSYMSIRNLNDLSISSGVTSGVNFFNKIFNNNYGI